MRYHGLSFLLLLMSLRKSSYPAFGRPLTTTEKSGGVSLNHPGMEKPTVLRHRIPTFDYPSSMTSPIPCVSCTLLCGIRPTLRFTRTAIFHEQKKLAFLLPLIVEAHELLPPTPLFWVNDDNTIPLWRTTLWLHEDTIQWLAETGESYPPELRDEIQPRLIQLKPSQHTKRSQPPPPPKPTRWTDRTATKQPVQALQEAAPQDPKGTQNTPQQVADRERQYMELQSIIAQANQRTLADSRPADSKQTQKPANLLAASQQSTERCNRRTNQSQYRRGGRSSSSSRKQSAA